MNDFDLLGISPTTDKLAIRRAYVQRAKSAHPDRGGNRSEFERVQAAYDRLVHNDIQKNKVKTRIQLQPRDFLLGCTATAAVPITDTIGRIIEFTVPAWTTPGTTIEFDAVHDSTILRVCVKVEIKCDQDELILNDVLVRTVYINSKQAQQGICLNVDAIDRSVNVNIPPNTTASKLIYNFTEQGFFAPYTQNRGDLKVIVKVQERKHD